MNNKNYPNLKPWQPGQSGNPAGRKPGSKNISTIIQKLLDQYATADTLSKSSVGELVDGMPTTYAEAVAMVAIYKALNGDMRAIAWLAEQQERGETVQEVATREPLIISHLKPRFTSTVE